MRVFGSKSSNYNLQRYSNGYKENIFSIDSALNTIVYPDRLVVNSKLKGILLRTALLGESLELFNKQQSPVRIYNRIERKWLLLFHYSRFFMVANWLEPVAGPRPIVSDKIVPSNLFKFGLLWNNSTESATYLRLAEVLDKYFDIDLIDFFKSQPTEGFSGFQLDSLEPLEFRYVSYRSLNGSLQDDQKVLNFLESPGIEDKYSIDYFERSRQQSLFVGSMEKALKKEKSSLNCGGILNGSESQIPKYAFRQSGLPDKNFKISCYNFKCR